MALEATHIRFSLDLKNNLGVENLGRYIFGSIYPDSRYFTKTERFLTHPSDFKSLKLDRGDDFQKGWYSHLLADVIQKQATRELIPEIFIGDEIQGGEVWIKHTAIKILLDINDAKKFPIANLLSGLEIITGPNGESQKSLEEYSRIFIDMYSSAHNLSTKDYQSMWKKMNMSEDLAIKIEQQTNAFSQNLEMMQKILQIYDKMLIKANKL